jgi:hypothetical protein
LSSSSCNSDVLSLRVPTLGPLISVQEPLSTSVMLVLEWLTYFPIVTGRL